MRGGVAWHRRRTMAVFAVLNICCDSLIVCANWPTSVCCKCQIITIIMCVAYDRIYIAYMYCHLMIYRDFGVNRNLISLANFCFACSFGCCSCMTLQNRSNGHFNQFGEHMRRSICNVMAKTSFVQIFSLFLCFSISKCSEILLCIDYEIFMIFQFCCSLLFGKYQLNVFMGDQCLRTIME